MNAGKVIYFHKILFQFISLYNNCCVFFLQVEIKKNDYLMSISLNNIFLYSFTILIMLIFYIFVMLKSQLKHRTCLE